MRMIFNIRIPNQPFNTLVLEGTAGDVIGRIMEECQPEAIYFTEQDGARGAIAVFEVATASDIPRLAEPWFLKLDATCQVQIAMTLDDLQKADLGALGAKWKS
ncbi:MAG TPA: panthothenate synthetase [Trinickia sp.]|nr:panthothenate synthetase [Trinickia sp.]